METKISKREFEALALALDALDANKPMNAIPIDWFVNRTKKSGRKNYHQRKPGASSTRIKHVLFTLVLKLTARGIHFMRTSRLGPGSTATYGFTSAEDVERSRALLAEHKAARKKERAEQLRKARIAKAKAAARPARKKKENVAHV